MWSYVKVSRFYKLINRMIATISDMIQKKDMFLQDRQEARICTLDPDTARYQ